MVILNRWEQSLIKRRDNWKHIMNNMRDIIKKRKMRILVMEKDEKNVYKIQWISVNSKKFVPGSCD